MESDPTRRASQEDVLKLVSDLRTKVDELQEHLAGHWSTRGKFWDGVRERLFTMEARFASFEVKLGAVAEELWDEIGPDLILEELQQIRDEVTEMSREIHTFTAETPM